MANAKLARWLAGFGLAAGLGVVCWLGFAESRSESKVPEFRFQLPRVPSQPIASTLNCTSTYKSELFPYISGEWSITASEGGCTFTSGGPFSVKATAAEMRLLTYRPQISYQVRADGRLTHPSLVRSSGSATLDQRAIQEALKQRYRHNCGSCYVTTLVDVEFQGPVWIRDGLRTRPPCR